MSDVDIGKCITETTRWISRKYYTWGGLIAQYGIAAVVLLKGCEFAIRTLGNIRRTPPDFFKTVRSELLFIFSVWLTLCLCITIIWMLRRRLPQFRGPKTGVLFGPSHKEEIRSDLHNLEGRLIEEIQAKDFSNIIVVKRLPPNRRISTHAQASNILNRSSAHVIIWGSFERNTTKGVERTGFTSISITWRSIAFNPKELHRAVGDAIVGRKWNWDANNTIDQILVADNLSQLSRYIVALSLLARRQHENAQKILGPLLGEVNAKYGHEGTPASLRRFTKTVGTLYAVSLIERASQVYLQRLYDENIFLMDKTVCTECIAQIEEGLRHDEHIPKGWMLLAIFEFLAGNMAKAKECVHRARNTLIGSQQMGCDFSEAFLLAFENRYREAKKVYKRVFQAKESPDTEMLKNVLLFVQQAVAAFPDKPQMRFIYGMLNDECGHKELAGEELRQFVSISLNRRDLDRWDREARFRLERLELRSQPGEGVLMAMSESNR